MRLSTWALNSSSHSHHSGHFVSRQTATASESAKQHLEEFEALPDHEQSEVVAELVRRVALAPHDGPSDDDLLAAADRLFVELDQRERS
jgi:hypothetical protein